MCKELGHRYTLWRSSEGREITCPEMRENLEEATFDPGLEE